MTGPARIRVAYRRPWLTEPFPKMDRTVLEGLCDASATFRKHCLGLINSGDPERIALFSNPSGLA